VLLCGIFHDPCSPAGRTAALASDDSSDFVHRPSPGKSRTQISLRYDRKDTLEERRPAPAANARTAGHRTRGRAGGAVLADQDARADEPGGVGIAVRWMRSLLPP